MKRLPNAELLVLVVLVGLALAELLEVLEFGLEKGEEDELDEGVDLRGYDDAGSRGRGVRVEGSAERSALTTKKRRLREG